MQFVIHLSVAYLVVSTGFICCLSSNYDDYILGLALRSQELEKDFERHHPSGRLILDHLGSQEYINSHPLFNAPSSNLEHDISSEEWTNFMRELQYLGETAVFDNDEAIERLQKANHIWKSGRPDRTIGQRGFILENASEHGMEVSHQNHLWGDHRVSGGAGETGMWLNYAVVGAGLQDIDDEAYLPPAVQNYDNFGRLIGASGVKFGNLPAYCDPPNPCPIGYDPDQLQAPCDQDILDTVFFNRKWIWNQILKNECSCDVDHMQFCPADKIDSGPFNQPLGEVSKISVNPYFKGKKRSQLSAKKSRNYFRRPRRYKIRLSENPYFDGTVLRKIVKKNGRIWT